MGILEQLSRLPNFKAEPGEARFVGVLHILCTAGPFREGSEVTRPDEAGHRRLKGLYLESRRAVTNTGRAPGHEGVARHSELPEIGGTTV